MAECSKRLDLLTPVCDRDHVWSSGRATIQLVKYGDYQCPHSAAAHQVIQTLQQQLGERLQFVFRHFPRTDVHPHAQHAAEAAEAAGAQGKFWQMHDQLFAHQQAIEDGYLVQYALQLGLDMNRFLREMTGDVHVKRIQADIQSGIQSGVRQTPTFFINGIRLDKEWNVATFMQIIQDA